MSCTLAEMLNGVWSELMFHLVSVMKQILSGQLMILTVFLRASQPFLEMYEESHLLINK